MVIDREPSDETHWYSTTTTTTINCVLEETFLSYDPAEEKITTPLGTAKVQTGYVSHNHLTVIWDTTFPSTVDRKPQLLGSGKGILYTRSVDGILRLHDEEKQLEFHLLKCDYPAPCVTNNTLFVLSEDHLFIRITTFYRTKLSRKPPTFVYHPFTSTSLDIHLHLQFIRDQLTDDLNELST